MGECHALLVRQRRLLEPRQQRCAIGSSRENLELLAARPDGAVLLSRLQEAALADEEGATLASEIASIAGNPARSPEAGRARAAGQPA